MSSAAEGDALTVTVRALSSDGAGVADLPDGRVAFVPRTAPGDVAEVRLTRSKKRWARAELRRLVEPSALRAEPPCALYARCGGCQLQHLPYEEQLAAKGRIVADALQRIGGLSVEPPPVEPSPARLRYRNRVSYTLRRLGGGRVVAGFHALDRPSHVLDVHAECLLPLEPLTSAWVALRAAWGPGARHLPSGGRLRLTLRLADDAVDLAVDGGEGRWSAGELLEALGEHHPFTAIWHRPSGRKTTIRVHPAADAPDGAPRHASTAAGVDGSAGAPAAPVFAQANGAAAALLRAFVLEEAFGAGEGASPGTAVDAYCGTGPFARELAARGVRTVGIELDPAAADAARAGCPAGLEILEGAVESVLSEALPAELVLLNPPRSGLADEVPGVLLATPPARIIYVSCDPATLARDLARLGGRYELRALRAFDLFPQTSHVETVAVLELAE